ncbi:hypothetical protein [Ancylobacter sp.]|uniref:hypothetical protein n=1 Tax=Ancylobacter sp. TaxID=1872567 RepID=UPI003D151794
MTYLIFPTLGAAMARSAQAWLACLYPAGETRLLWSCIEHPQDGRAALILPATPDAAQIGISPEAYEALLTQEERQARLEALPGEGWPDADA